MKKLCNPFIMYLSFKANISLISVVLVVLNVDKSKVVKPQSKNIFIKFVDLVIDPKGSLLDFTNSLNDLDANLADKFNELSIYFE